MKSLSIRSLLLAAAVLAVPAASFGGVFVSVSIAPPVLPVYVQPPCPGPDYLWTPGYWAYGPEGYFWVPGTWVVAPQPGLLWTPGYWGFGGGVYVWHAGYWGPHVGFYGGVNYGFGYGGIGFGGGMWEGGHFRYNTAVTNVNTTVIHNTYVNNTVINNHTTINRTSFNGPGGVNRQPTAEETSYGREHHFGQTNIQSSHENAAGSNRSNLVSVNHGRPANAAMARPAAESGNRGNFTNHGENGAPNRGNLANHGENGAPNRGNLANHGENSAPNRGNLANHGENGAPNRGNFNGNRGNVETNHVTPENRGGNSHPVEERRGGGEREGREGR